MLLALLLAVSFHDCGREREAAKTLRDRGARKLDAPRRATVEQLIGLRRPRRWRWAARHELERAVVQIDVEVLAFKDEKDGDIHAIIRGGLGHLMIAEFPAVVCTMGSAYALPMQRARLHFEQLMRQHIQRVRLTGVLFFDKKHGQNGVAPNGIELHPVLAVEAAPAGDQR